MFDALNKGKEWKETIKPFNFFLVGFQVMEEDGQAIKPIAPFSKDPQKIVYEPFLNKYTGDIKRGPEFFKPLSMTILQYADHPEYKYEGDIGQMKRRHIHVDSVILIGKKLTILMTNLWMYGRLRFSLTSRRLWIRYWN
jgi:hypothetical protein